MNAIHTEILYYQRRLVATRAMADAAAGPCARSAHDLLAQLYGETLKALSTQAANLAVEPVLTFAMRGMARTPPHTQPRSRSMSLHVRPTLKLAS